MVDAIGKIGSFDSHALTKDLNFGFTKPSEIHLLQYIEKEQTVIGKMV